jgi:dUTP pyrophosphatase
MLKLIVKAKRLREGARLPLYATAGAAGLDLYSCLEQPLVLAPGKIVRVPTGIAVAIPQGYVGLIRDRSSLALAGFHTVAGVIDSDYRGEILIAAYYVGSGEMTIENGDRIAQMIILHSPQAEIVEAKELPHTERGAGGFGSTGR